MTHQQSRAMEIKRSFYSAFAHEFEIDAVEDVACNLCGASIYRLLEIELGFEIRECAVCGLVYVSPQPAEPEIAKLYRGMYAGLEPGKAEVLHSGNVDKHIRKIILGREPNGPRLLEVGCGIGTFLETIQSDGFEMSAIEMDEIAAQFAGSRVPEATVQATGIATADVPAASQHCIVAIAVLEHVKDPRAALRHMTEWLAPGGLLVLQVPRVAPFIRVKRFLPWLPVFFEAPRHLFDFSPKTLGRYLGEFGYRDVRVDVARPYSANGWFGLAMIWAVKIPGMLLHALSGGRYIYPYAAAFVMHAVKPDSR